MSEKSIAEKLQIKAGARVWVSDPAHADRVGPLPAGAEPVATSGDATVGLFFAADAAGLRRLLDTHRERLAGLDLVWIAYPKGNRADINRDSVWPILGEYGMRPQAQVAIDDVWSALRFRANREGEAPFTGGR